MKDLLSEVLKRKRFCLEKCSTAFEVAQVFEGLLSVVSKTKGQSVVELLTNALSDLVLEDTIEIAACNALRETDIGEVEADTGKSGKLDKVNDDCLRLALGFLSASDRMENVEVSCRRLFHLSRSVPYDFMCFGSAVKLLGVSSFRVAAFARRIQCSSFFPLGGQYSAAMPTCARVLRPFIEQLHLKGDSDALAQLTFPKLAKCFDSLSVSPATFCAFISRHSSLRQVATCHSLTPKLLEAICGLYNVTAVFANSIDASVLEAVRQKNWDLSTFHSFGCHLCDDFSLLKPFLHSGLRHFCVNGTFTDTSVCVDELQLPNLTSLKLVFGKRHTAAVSLRNLKLKTSAKMESIACVASLLDLDECLRLCPFGNVQFTAVTDFCTSVQVSALSQRLLTLFCDKSKHKHRSLSISLMEPETDGGLAIARHFVQFLVACMSIAPVKIQLRVAARIHRDLNQALTGDMSAKVWSSFDYSSGTVPFTTNEMFLDWNDIIQ